MLKKLFFVSCLLLKNDKKKSENVGRCAASASTYKLRENEVKVHHSVSASSSAYQLKEFRMIPAASRFICAPFVQDPPPAPPAQRAARQGDQTQRIQRERSKRRVHCVISARLTGVAAYHTLYFCGLLIPAKLH